MPDGSLLLELVDESGAVTAAQTITRRGKATSDRFSKARGISRRKRARTPQSVLIAEAGYRPNVH
jgi:putative DNA primase/helicase